MRPFAFTLFVLVALFVSACRPVLPRCEVNEQCPSTQVCIDGACVDPDSSGGPDGGDQDDPDAGLIDRDGDGGVITPDPDADAGFLDDGRDGGAPGEPFDSGPSDPPVNNGRDGG